MADFARLFAVSERHKIIDVGGYAGNWLLIEPQPDVLLVNIDAETHKSGRFRKVKGDGRALQFPDQTFDIAYSNSVIEHVGTWSDQQAFAREIRRVGRSYYVQTPNRHFPIEPHVLAPFVQYLPRALAVFAIQYLTPHAWKTRPTRQWAEDFADQTRLLTAREMRRLFPDATIVKERFLGLTKSIIAYRV